MFMVTPPHDTIFLKDIIQWCAVSFAVLLTITVLWINLDTGKWTKRYRNWRGWKDYD